MSHEPSSGVIETIANSGEGLLPPATWQQAVRREIKRPVVIVERPRAAFYALTSLLAMSAVTIALLWAARIDHRATAKRDKLAMLDALKELEEQINQAQLDIDMAQARMDEAFRQLEAAKSAEEKALAIASRKQAQMQLMASRQRMQELREQGLRKEARQKKAKSKRQKEAINKCINSSDPLCGL